MNNTKKSILKWLRNGLMVAVLAFAIAYFSASQKQERYLSNESAFAFKNLNTQHGMVVTEDLFNDEEQSNLLAGLLHADIMMSTEKIGNQGLIVSFDKNEGEALLLQPTALLDENELKDIALYYENAVPEAHFEVDQNLLTSSDFDLIQSVQVQVSILDNLTPEQKEIREKMISGDYNEEPAKIDEAEVTDKNEQAVQLASTSSEIPEITQKEVHVAVIDSGLQINHPQFNNNTVTVNPGANVIKGTSDVTDDIGHGTHVAGVIAAGAPDAVIQPYKIVDKNGGRLSNVLTAVNLAIEDDVDVINMSFGVMDSSYAFSNMIQKAESAGIIVVAAAGNFGANTGFYPASYDDTIAVGGVYANGEKMKTSNYGDWVDVAAVGYHIKSSIPENSYGYKDGTSQSAAFVSARVANLLKNYPKLSTEEILIILQSDGIISGGEFNGLPLIGN